MVSNHARKNAARGRRAATGENHRQAVDAVRNDDAGGDLVLVVDHPAPVLDGADPCPECEGRATSGDLYEQPSDGGRPPLLVASACTACMGCGRAEHGRCRPNAHVTDDGDESFEDYLDELDDEDQDQGEACPSCGGREYNVVQTAPAGDVDEDGPYAELLARARARGVSEWDVTGAAAFGELDELLGEGAQALAEAEQRRAVYLLMPCGCTEGRVRTVRRDELGAAR